MYQQFSFTTEIRGKRELIKLKGYLEDSGGLTLKSHIQESLDQGISLFAFASETAISSPGCTLTSPGCG